MTEKHTFDCTPREARRIAENLRYTAAARELADAAEHTLGQVYLHVLPHVLQPLRTALETFRTIADE